MFAKALLLFRDLRFDLRFAHHWLLLSATSSDTGGFPVRIQYLILRIIVVTNVSNVIYNFERNGLSKVIYSEKVINLFQR